MSIGKRVSELRKKYHYSQEYLAKQLGISFQAVSKWETGQSSPDIDLLGRLSSIFNVSIDYLLDNQQTQDSHYNQRYDKADYYWGLEPNHSCYEVMKHKPPLRPYKLLEVGCGEGKDAVFFAKNGYQVTAFDASQKGIEKTRQLAHDTKTNLKSLVASVNEFRPQDTYDIVYSSSVLHLVQKPLAKAFLKDLIDKTQPGGLHMIQIHVKKPFIDKPPSPDPTIEAWQSGELFSLYSDHEILFCDEYVFDCQSGGQPHQHCANKIIARIL